MPAVPRPIWNAAIQRFRDQVTGRFLSVNTAVRWLPISRGAVRDVLGRFIPHRFLGGDIERVWPTGKLNYTAITRGLPVDLEEMVVRPFEHLTAQVEYTVGGEYRSPVGVTMPSGRSYAEPLADERISRRFIAAADYPAEERAFIEETEILDVKWSVTTFLGTDRMYGGEREYWETYG